MELIILKSFIFNGNGGNGAGLVILDNDITQGEMLDIASKVGLSETAFVKNIDEKNYNVRFFTPVCEIELCGHATIAAFYYIGEYMLHNKPEKQLLYQHTKLGRLEIELEYKDKKVSNVLMTQANPCIYGGIEENDMDILAKSLNIDVNDIMLPNYEIKPTMVSTGVKDIIIPVRSRKILNSINPSLSMICDISKKYNCCGYHVYSIDEKQIYARNFAPSVGINEECATGTSNGALGALLYKNNIVNGGFTVLQGEAMNELSSIYVYVDDTTVKVGGIAKVIER